MLEDPLLLAEQSDEFWKTRKHDLSEIERAWQQEEQVRQAAENEHKLNMRLKQALADGRDTLSQVGGGGGGNFKKRE